MNVLQFLASENFIPLNKIVIRSLGLEEAILIGELASEYNYWTKENGLDEDGYFYSTIENIEEKTTLSVHKQRKAINKLKELGVIDVKVKGIPAKRYIKIDEQQLYEILSNKFVKNSQTRELNINKLDNENLSTNNNILNNNIIKENISNKKKERKKTSYDDILNELDDEELKEALLEFIKMRKLIKKPLTDNALKLSIKKLFNLTQNHQEMIDIINQSIMNSWQSFYPLKKESKETSYQKSNDDWDKNNWSFMDL